MHYLGLLDCNNFFVSCERLFRPELKNKPTIVLSSNDGCVVARSEEVKQLNIPMGVPFFKVKDVLEKADVQIFSGNITLYRDISARVMKTLKEYVGEIEQYSVDESFFRIDATEDVEEFLIQIKKKIEQSIGVPVSLGAGKSKTIAKFASEYKKREEGICWFDQERWSALTPEIAIDKIWGIGGKTAVKLREQRVMTVEDFLQVDPARVQKIFGINGKKIQSELNGVSVLRLHERVADQKSIMSTRSFSKTISNLTQLELALAYHVNHVAKELRHQGKEALCVKLSLQTSRYSDWMLQGASGETFMSEPTNDTRVLLKEVTKLLREVYKQSVPYKKIGIIVSSLTSQQAHTKSLFTEIADKNSTPNLMKAIDLVNNKLGKEMITIGRTKKTRYQTNSSHQSPQYTTKWTDIPLVVAK